MLCKLFLLALFLAVVVAQDPEPAEKDPSYPDPNETAEEAWSKYKKAFYKSYDEEEDAKRFALFEKRYYEIIEHNKKYEAGEVSWSKGLNPMTDLTDEEFNNLLGLIPIPPNQKDV
ncbi:protein CTLA-2-beta-like [Diabrotica virgifera virgifera]|uniref:Cathepsin propeptide inhibitor domain-containing protein n=1 Tax=Diabrotica virgifera virgifera TaxID=50390 RepID=A0ABM5L4V8_DIAVI|nr:protein CTLA-2-beta-like [Diabrotica virgifera virgifera]